MEAPLLLATLVLQLLLPVSAFGASIVQRGKKNPTPSGHFLTDTELAPIANIPCLQAKQRDPTVQCGNSSGIVFQSGSSRTSQSGHLINAGNYPLYKDPACNGNGEFFCDPTHSLNSSDALKVTTQMSRLRENTMVSCPQRPSNQPANRRPMYPFYLGVVLAEGFPAIESDAQSLQEFGRIVAAQWNMNGAQMGPIETPSRCPNSAVLIILPDQKQAVLSSASCSFICQDIGGPEVVTRVLAALRSEGTFKAVLAGVDEVYRFLNRQKDSDKPSSASLASPGDSGQQGTSMISFLQRVVFVGSLMLLLLSLGVGVLVLLLAPGFITKKQLGVLDRV